MKGILVLNGFRPDIAYENGHMHGGLHCGDSVNCFIDGTWKSARIEYYDNWILICDSFFLPMPYGCPVEA